MSSFWSYLSVSVLMLVGLLLIFIILLQRGRGGGLAGAFGGAGGQSALGTKAGDVFTKITVGLAIIWVFLACLSIYALRYDAHSRTSGLPDAVENSAPEPSQAPPGGAGGDSSELPAAAGSTSLGTEGGGGASGPPDGEAPPANPEALGATEGGAADNTSEAPAGEPSP